MRTDDGRIIQECLNGERGAFGVLVDKYKEGIYAFAYSKLQDFQDAQDVTQEVFLRAYRDLRSLKRWESFGFWIYRIAYARCSELLKLKSRRADQDFIEDQEPAVINALSLDSYRIEQLSESVQEALNLLPEVHREILVLRYFGGMNSNEIAMALGVSPAAVRKRLSRAMAQLQEEMVAMMDTAFEGKRLSVGFTLNIVEAIKRIKISPPPRASSLPVGLSLAIGIMVAVFGLSSQMNVRNSYYSPAGSPLLMESRVLKNSEIPIQILKTAEISVISSKKGDLDGGESQNAVSPAPGSAKGTWGQKADMPTGRLAISCAEVNGKIYAIGGASGIRVYSPKVEEYDPELDKWTKKADMHTGRHAVAVTAVNGKIYAMGGYNAGTLSSVEEYDPINDTWTNKAPMPGPKGYHSAVTVNNMIYVLGGWANVDNNIASLSVLTYDPAIDQWARLKDLPKEYAIGGSSVVADDNKIYCFGGVNLTNGIMHKNVLVYDVQNEEWSTKAELASDRWTGVAAIIGRKVYFIGGSLVSYEGVSDVEEYDIDTNTVEKKTDMPHPRGNISGYAVDNKVFVIGGTTGWPGGSPRDFLDIVEEFDPGAVGVEAKDKLPAKWGEVKTE